MAKTAGEGGGAHDQARRLRKECNGGCCGLTGCLYDGGVSPGTFRISCDGRARGAGGNFTCHGGDGAFESLGG